MNTVEKTFIALCVTTILTTSSLTGQETPPTEVYPATYTLNCSNAPLDLLLDRLQKLTGKTITVDLGVNATFTLKTKGKTTASELIDLITQALNAQGIRLENLDENTIRVRGTSKPHSAESTPQRRTPKKYTQQELEVHLQNYQMQLIREGETPLDTQLTPENVEKLKSEGVVVPPSVSGGNTPSNENNQIK